MSFGGAFDLTALNIHLSSLDAIVRASSECYVRV